MPASINDYDQNDEDSGGLSEGFTPAQSNAVGSAQGPQQAKPQKQQDDSFTPWSSFVSANQDVSQREAGKLEGQVQGDVSKAQSDLSGAQSTFNNSVDSNYNQPSQSQAKAQKAGASPDQTHPQANDTSGSWSDLATPPAPAPASPAPKTPRVNPQTVTSATQPAPTQVTSQNPANAVIPTKLTRPQSGPVGTPTALPQQAQTGAQSQQRQSIGGYGYQALTPGANANGPHDLEQAAGQQGWAQLGLDTTKAQQAANALGSETGVQGLLQQQQYSPQQNTAFDAALINGQGGPQFAKLAQEYGGNQLEQNAINAEQASQNRWNQLMGDEATKQGFDAAGHPAPLAPLASSPGVIAPLTPASAPGQDTSGWDTQLENEWQTDMNEGQQQAKANNGKVVVTVGNSNTGIGNAGSGNDLFALASGQKAINVTAGPDGQADTSGWWGGAGGPPVGDGSIPAAEWYALALMTPEERAQWWKHNHGS